MPQVVIVSPALRDANNGNWRTARRWQAHLAGEFRTRIVTHWPDEASADDRVMIALHARRSAEAVAAWHAGRSPGGLAVVLTGTDLYRDIQTDASARRSLAMAGQLVVLQECAPAALPVECRAKTRVIFQSTTGTPDPCQVMPPPAPADGRSSARRKVPGDPVRRGAPAVEPARCGD
jgi:hypothetical protein